MPNFFDTHCHLNFSRFKKDVDEVVRAATEAGVKSIVIPGTDIPSSQKAIELAQKYAAEG
ncbi:TatD family hydrolase, partial [Candidatus Woesebacteria bacterium]|nr:TatD family hydrolase [Candidatus Woesebacteria bacterium]